MNASATETLEIDLLLEAIYRRYGYDFRAYARASLERRIRQALADSGEKTISALIPRILDDRAFFGRLVQQFSVPVTEMFRDPSVFLALREQVVPLLRTWPHVKAWVAGCATGEEAYSLAILLEEAGLRGRSTLYATDFNDESLKQAREGVYGIEAIQVATRNYRQSGGKRSFSDYYHARYDAAVMDAALRRRITFANHNLAVDGVFGEMHLVFCRNVMIYFNRDLQNRVLEIFAESLVHGGFLCIGTREDLRFSSVQERFGVVDVKERIYKKQSL